MPGYFFSSNALLLLWVVLILAIIGFILIFFTQLILPYLRIQDSLFFDPPYPGKFWKITVDEGSRISTFKVGQKTGDLPTRCNAIAEDQLIFIFKKSKEDETYDIIIKRNGSTLFRPPRMEKFLKMDSVVTIQSYELIGNSALFRISDKIVKDRMVNYIEIGLNTEFFFNKAGTERMRFIITVTNIQPGINTSKKLKGKVYPFGVDKKSKTKEDSDDENDQENLD